MKGNLEDAQAAMRLRQQLSKCKRINVPKTRRPTEEELRLFFLEDLERESLGLKPKKHPRRILIKARAPAPKKIEKEPADRRKKHGNRWSAYGTVNADSETPASATNLSIRNWGFKIKVREQEELCKSGSNISPGGNADDSRPTTTLIKRET